MSAPTPVSVITGFLGSGKTTLLRHLLRDPAMGRTAVIINEFGEIGIDHDLVESSDENFIELTTGCLCCKVRSDLVMTLRDMARRRADGLLPPFERVLIETSGLADPAAILQALMIDRDLAGLYALGEVVTTVDALLGAATLDRHRQSVRQVAVADRLLLTKGDLVAGTDALDARLQRLNPGATRQRVAHGAIGAAELFGVGNDRRAAAARGYFRLDEVRAPAIAGPGADAHAGLHDPGIVSWCLVRDRPVHALTLPLFLEGLMEHCGDRLLRVKGIVDVVERPGRPAVLHGVQHVFHPPEWLDRWPSDDRRTRLVFIGEALPSRWISTLLDVLDDDVDREQARHARAQAGQPAP
ncbi:MAG: GTP-binding protein [Betaproteobacteria bacterium]|jgi:G3E family GTPase|nr:GTP-binding protein [Betaproteobacteria bacterium]